MATQKKKIVILCDGTWLSRGEALIKGARLAFGIEYYSNIALMAQCLKKTDHDGVPQIAYYLSGVGTTPGILTNIIAGATGNGLNENVAQAYSFIVDNYHPGDELYLFGFSRGAYTARVLADFINYAGVLKKSQQGFITPIIAAYQRRSPWRPDLNRQSAEILYHYSGKWPSYGAIEVEKQLVKTHSLFTISGEDELKMHWTVPTHQPRVEPPLIKAIGVFDTVGALGVPGTFNLPTVRARYDFFDNVLPSNIQYAYQALAFDENRADFSPTLWKVRSDKKHAFQIVKQTWFKGSHPDVGGGFYEHGLSDVSLAWMTAQMMDHNEGPLLVFDLELMKQTQDRTRPWALQPAHPTRLPIMFMRTRQVQALPAPEERSEKESITEEAETPGGAAGWQDGVTLSPFEPTTETLHYSMTLGPSIRPETSPGFAVLRTRNPAKLREMWQRASDPQTLLPTERELLWDEPEIKLQPLSIAYGALYGWIPTRLSTRFQGLVELIGALATIFSIYASFFTAIPARVIAFFFTLSFSAQNLLGVPPANPRAELENAGRMAQMAWEAIKSPDTRALEVVAEPILLAQKI